MIHPKFTPKIKAVFSVVAKGISVPLRSILSRGGFLFLRGTLLYHVVVCHPTSGIRFRSGSSAQISSHFGEIRTVEVNGEPWFVGKDVAQVLGYSNTKKALTDHVDDEDKFQGDGVTIRDPMGREQHPTIINESCLTARNATGLSDFHRCATLSFQQLPDGLHD